MKTCENSGEPMLGQLTLFAADTHASLSPQPGDAEARKMTAISGQNLVGSWLNSGPLGSLERTLLGTSAWASTMCFLTWKDKVTPAGRLLFQLAPSVPHTDGTECGLWATPTRTANQAAPSMQKHAGVRRMLATPTKMLGNNQRPWPSTLKQTKTTASVFSMLPTPSAADNRDRGGPSNPSIQRRKEIGKQVNLSMLWNGQLNPRFVEEMMGFPPDWSLPD